MTEFLVDHTQEIEIWKNVYEKYVGKPKIIK